MCIFMVQLKPVYFYIAAKLFVFHVLLYGAYTFFFTCGFLWCL